MQERTLPDRFDGGVLSMIGGSAGMVGIALGAATGSILSVVIGLAAVLLNAKNLVDMKREAN